METNGCLLPRPSIGHGQGSRSALCVQVEWEEYWWEASDWAGMKEMGAEKSGCSAQGAAWRETWKEALTFDHATGEPVVDRTAHKWAHDEKVRHGLLWFAGGMQREVSACLSLI